MAAACSADHQDLAAPPPATAPRAGGSEGAVDESTSRRVRGGDRVHSRGAAGGTVAGLSHTSHSAPARRQTKPRGPGAEGLGRETRSLGDLAGVPRDFRSAPGPEAG